MLLLTRQATLPHTRALARMREPNLEEMTGLLADAARLEAAELVQQAGMTPIAYFTIARGRASQP